VKPAYALEYRGPEITPRLADPEDPARWARDLMTKAVLLLRLFQPGPIAPLLVCVGDTPSTWAWPVEPYVRLGGEPDVYDLDDDSRVAELQGFWAKRREFLRSGDLEAFAFWLSRAAVSRLTSLKVFHWVQALESILLPERDGDLRYRFALRGALLARNHPEIGGSPDHVHDLLYAAYDLRNHCAHGMGLHEINKRLEKSFNNTQLLQLQQWTHGIAAVATGRFAEMIKPKAEKRGKFFRTLLVEGLLCKEPNAGA
jgi:hypothetical protein